MSGLRLRKLARIHQCNEVLEKLTCKHSVLGEQASATTQLVRFLPGLQNGRAGQSWQALCKSSKVWFISSVTDISHAGQYPPPSTTSEETLSTRFDGIDTTVYVRQHVTTTLNALIMLYRNNPNRGDLLSENPCVPTILAPHVEPGFALFTDDVYYQNNGMMMPQKYKVAPLPSVTNGKIFLQRRDADLYLLEQPPIVVVDEGNSSRLATNDEIHENTGTEVIECSRPDCKKELAQIDAIESAYLADISPVMPPVAAISGVSDSVTTTAKASQATGPIGIELSAATAAIASSTEPVETGSSEHPVYSAALHNHHVRHHAEAHKHRGHH